ncbi:multidrug ABC transporter ATPase [uncultured Schumannella sp.]|uniref:multidrug ABC transporter ATPase n=1 Tax=uncultured Schumannella sp. TaxID=1195956 RepID=UPI0025DA5F5E|nr:multidrug ABC transporter ATPase [uncultured Schumannella sp.]
MTDETRVPLNRIERILATMIATVGGLSVIAIASVFMGRAAGADMASGVWPAVALLPSLGLPITFALIVAFLIVSVVRRRRLAQDGAE